MTFALITKEVIPMDLAILAFAALGLIVYLIVECLKDIFK